MLIMGPGAAEALAELQGELSWLEREHPDKVRLAGLARRHLDTIRRAGSCESVTFSTPGWGQAKDGDS